MRRSKFVVYGAAIVPSSDQPRHVIKIGVSSALSLRMKDLQKCFPFEIRLVYRSRPLLEQNARRIEKLMHLHFRPYRLRGEWFATDLGWAEFINAEVGLTDPVNLPTFETHMQKILKTLVAGKTKTLKQGGHWRA